MNSFIFRYCIQLSSQIYNVQLIIEARLKREENANFFLCDFRRYISITLASYLKFVAPTVSSCSKKHEFQGRMSKYQKSVPSSFTRMFYVFGSCISKNNKNGFLRQRTESTLKRIHVYQRKGPVVCMKTHKFITSIGHLPPFSHLFGIGNILLVAGCERNIFDLVAKLLLGLQLRFYQQKLLEI